MLDSTLSIRLPADHELARPRDGFYSSSRHSAFRTRAAALIETDFEKCWPVREGRCGNTLELKVVVPDECLDNFRTRIQDLGFTEEVEKEEDSSAEAAGRKS